MDYHELYKKKIESSHKSDQPLGWLIKFDRHPLIIQNNLLDHLDDRKKNIRWQIELIKPNNHCMNDYLIDLYKNPQKYF